MMAVLAACVAGDYANRTWGKGKWVYCQWCSTNDSLPQAIFHSIGYH